MRFHLVYQGPLSAAGNRSKLGEVVAIRSALSPQLKHLWLTHQALIALEKHGALPPKGHNYMMSRSQHEAGMREIALGRPEQGWIDLCCSLDVAGCPYRPLVREALDLSCELDILFLRQQDPGALLSQGGDIDNRIKTLLDALRMPSAEEERKQPSPARRDVYCLMESDTLVSRLNVDTDRLLFPASDKPNEVHLVIEVTVNVLNVRPYNMCLL